MSVRRVELRGTADGGRTAALPECRWFTRLQLLASGGESVGDRSGDEESALLVLGGTHDLQAGAGTWAGRGRRATPYQGRPVALFLPPNTKFSCSGGEGELLWVAARQPERVEPEVAVEKLGRKPLLPMAGSGKAFDPTTGEWKPTEAFPDSAEAILPRRIEQLRVGDCRIERVFPVDYKAAVLSLDEVVLPVDGELALTELAPPGVDELLVYCRTEGELEVRHGQVSERIAGEGSVLVDGAGIAGVTVTAGGAEGYATLCWAGPKPRS